MARTATLTVCTILLASLLAVVPQSGASSAAQPGGLDLVEIRPDRSLLLEWEASGAAAYQVGLGTNGGSINAIAIVSAEAGSNTIRHILAPTDDWPAETGVAYRVAVRDFGASNWSTAAPFEVNPSAQLAATQTAATTTSVSVSWSQWPQNLPFERYQIFVAAEQQVISTCLAAEFSSRSTTSSTITQTGNCSPQTLQLGEDYTVGVRVVQNSNPLVVTRIESTTTATGGAAQPSERFSTAQAGGEWRIVNSQGTPAVWHGVNVRRNNGGRYITAASETAAMANAGFDTVRIVMRWDRFQPSPNGFDEASFDAVDELVAAANSAGLNVVLDPIHVTDNTLWNIPAWAWRSSNNGSPSGNKLLEVVGENVHPYLTYVAQRYRDDRNVVAIDLLNEPREPVIGALASNNQLLMRLYHDMIETVRDIDPEKPIALEPFYGSAQIAPSVLSTVRDATVGDPSPMATDAANLIWSVHDYYVGNEGDASDDGMTPDGYVVRGVNDAGTPLRTERWDRGGCYPAGASPETCTWQQSRKNRLIPSMQVHVESQHDTAQAGSMPLFVGEYGIPHPSPPQDGWAGGDMYLSDKNAIYDGLNVSRSVWAWSTELDQTFGLYTRANGRLHPWASYASGESQVAPAGSGDVDCDGARTASDAQALLDVVTVLRPTAPDCGQAVGDEVVTANGDLNSDRRADSRDALIIAQCLVDAGGEHC